MAEKYNITTNTDGMREIDDVSEGENGKRILHVGGYNANILIGQDHDAFQLEKVENVYDQKGSVSIYKLVHKNVYIVAGKGR